MALYAPLIADKGTGSVANLSDVYMAGLNLTESSFADVSATWPSFLEPPLTFDGLVAEGVTPPAHFQHSLGPPTASRAVGLVPKPTSAVERDHRLCLPAAQALLLRHVLGGALAVIGNETYAVFRC
jgi:hypothetical protein